MPFSKIHPRYWLFAAFFSANLLFALVLALALKNDFEMESELNLRTAQNLALAIERTVSGTFDKIDLVLQEASDMAETQLQKSQTINHEAMSAEILPIGPRLPEIDVFRYADAEGIVAANSGYPAGSKAISIADRDYFKTLRDNPNIGMVTSKPVLGRTSNKWVIAFARRIQHADGRFAGVVYAAVSVNHFTDTFQQLQLGHQSAVTIFDPNHAIIARYPAPANPDLLGQRIPQNELINLMKSGQRTFTHIYRTHLDGIERSFSFHRFLTRPYYVSVGLSTDELHQGSIEHLGLAITVFLIFIGITGFFTWQLSRSWRRQDKANEQITLEKDRVRILNQSLETRVEQRTKELLNANQELKLALDHLGHSEKLAGLGNLVAGISHELNSPIGNLRLAASTYKERMIELSAELSSGSLRRSALAHFLTDADELVALIERNAERANEIVSSFKTVAVDQSSNRRRTFDLQKTIDDVISTMRPKLRRGHCTINNEIPSEIFLDSYPGAFMQIIGNLVDNALMHAFEGQIDGTITIKLLLKTPDEVSLRFSDNGHGIAEKDKEHIFEPFYSSKIGKGGSGLGLHLVRQMTTHPLGGSLELESTAVRGASFILKLPLTAPTDTSITP